MQLSTILQQFRKTQTQLNEFIVSTNVDTEQLEARLQNNHSDVTQATKALKSINKIVGKQCN